jgi:aryl-alcohol dehydrogenase
VVERIRDLTKGGVFYSVETTAQVQSFKDAISCLARGGICGICAVPDYGKPFEFSPAAILSGRTLKGVLEGSSVPDVFIPMLMKLHLQGSLPYDRFVKYYDFADLPTALADGASGQVIKPILRIS